MFLFTDPHIGKWKGVGADNDEVGARGEPLDDLAVVVLSRALLLPGQHPRGINQRDVPALGCSLSQFVGIYRQKLIESSKNDFWLRFEGPCVVYSPCLHWSTAKRKENIY